jgi:hypothetical protein
MKCYWEHFREQNEIMMGTTWELDGGTDWEFLKK